MDSGCNPGNFFQVPRCNKCHAVLRSECYHDKITYGGIPINDCRRCSQNKVNIRFVEVSKVKGEALGLTLRSSSSGRCIVARIIHGGLIHKTGLIHVRDEILEIDGNLITGLPVSCAQQLLVNSGETLILKIAASLKGPKPAHQMYVRAMFDYDPLEDSELPCPELGQPFEIGDILEIVDSSDFSWWQARKCTFDCQHSLTGLIPSSELMESRLIRATNEKLLSYSMTSHAKSSLSVLNLISPLQKPILGGSFSSTEVSSLGEISSHSRPYSHWLSFRRKSNRKQLSSSIERDTSSRKATLNSTPKSLSMETFSSLALDGTDNYVQIPIGGFCENILNGRSANHSHMCSKCNSVVQTTSSASTSTGAGVVGEGGKRHSSTAVSWGECARLLWSEVAFAPYEEVVRVDGTHFRYRSLLLLGARGVGRSALRRALVRARPDLFAQIIPYTTRKPEPNEVNGEHFYFVQEEELAADLVSKEFLEYGQRRNILFGIRLDSIRATIMTGLMPVLDIEPRALKILRSPEFAPIVVLLVPPSLNRLLSRDGYHEILDTSLTQMVQESEILEFIYRPYVNCTLVHRSVEASVDKVIALVQSFKNSTKWVPVGWTY